MSSFLHRLGDALLAKGLDAERKRAGFTARSVQLSLGPLAYDTNSGDRDVREAVLLLHGAGSDRTSWLRFAGQLVCPWPVLIPDLPGHGQSSLDPALDYTIAGQVRHVEALLAALGITRVHLVGNSIGGAIALGLAARAPGLVRSLVLISAAGVGVYGSALQRAAAQGGHNPLVTIRSVEDFRTMLRFGMAKPPYLPGFIVSALTRERIRRNAINERVAAAIDRDMDQTAKLASITAPALIIWGERDQVLPVDNARLLGEALAHSETVVLKGIGHAAMVEAPKETAALCTDFYQKIAAPPEPSARDASRDADPAPAPQ